MRYPRSAIETSHDACRWRCAECPRGAPRPPGGPMGHGGRADRWEMRGDWGLASRLRPPVRPPVRRVSLGLGSRDCRLAPSGHCFRVLFVLRRISYRNSRLYLYTTILAGMR